MQFPLKLKFKVTTIANDFLVRDGNNEIVLFVVQKMLPLTVDILIYSDETKYKLLYRIDCKGPILSFDVSWKFYDKDERYIGRLRHPSITSNWSAYYEIYNSYDEMQYEISDDNPYIRILNTKLKRIPYFKFLTGLLFNPSYILLDLESYELFRLNKTPALLGNKFSVDRLSTLDTIDQELCLLALFMMILQEKNRG